MDYIYFFNKAEESDEKEIGEKGLSLAKLSKSGFNVPPGFIIANNIFESLLSIKELKSAVNELMKSNSNNLIENSAKVQKLIKTAHFPEHITDEIIEAYLSLSVDLDKTTVASLLETKEVFVAVRSSYTKDELLLRHKSILNIKGKENLFKTILECYAANFSPENIKLMQENNLNKINSAIIIQKMINSEKSGIAFSINPDGSDEEIVIRACFGLGQGISSDNVLPDVYVIDRISNEIKDIKVSEKGFEFIRDDEGQTEMHELGSRSGKQVLEDVEINEIVRLLKKAVKTFEGEHIIEWAIKKDKYYVLQSRSLYSERPIESVEMEITENNEEPPEFIDISEPEPEEQLSESNEIIEIESEEPIEEEQEQDAPKEVEEVKIEESKEEDFIFSDYKEPEVHKHKETSRFSELAKLSSGNIIVYCIMFLKKKLSEKLKPYTEDIPDDFIRILDLLREYENIESEDVYRRLNKAKVDFLEGKSYPEPEDVKIALRIVEE